MVFGTFDILHMGHIHMFEQAREYGDKLIVVVARDENVEKIKGMGALYEDTERIKFLQHIDIIDEVVLGNAKDPYKVVLDNKPDIIALGYDQKVFVDNLEDALTRAGLETQIVRITPYRENSLKSNKIRKYIERIV